MQRDELRNALSSAKSLTISVDDYIYFQELKKADSAKGINLSDEPLEVEPFAITDADTILRYREELLEARGWYFDDSGNYAEFKLNREVIRYDRLRTMSDKEFFEEINK